MTACPNTYEAAKAHHDLVRADAATGHPKTPHGRALLASSRPWPDFDMMVGECGGCRSSLCFELQGTR